MLFVIVLLPTQAHGSRVCWMRESEKPAKLHVGLPAPERRTGNAVRSPGDIGWRVVRSRRPNLRASAEVRLPDLVAGSSMIARARRRQAAVGYVRDSVKTCFTKTVTRRGGRAKTNEPAPAARFPRRQSQGSPVSPTFAHLAAAEDVMRTSPSPIVTSRKSSVAPSIFGEKSQTWWSGSFSSGPSRYACASHGRFRDVTVCCAPPGTPLGRLVDGVPSFGVPAIHSEPWGFLLETISEFDIARWVREDRRLRAQSSPS